MLYLNMVDIVKIISVLLSTDEQDQIKSYLDVELSDSWCGLQVKAYLWVKDSMGIEYRFNVPDSLP
jgi:predicted 3-demethylubiquinone-9 3-methyltransferase (glyoxalase superfamily)